MADRPERPSDVLAKARDALENLPLPEQGTHHFLEQCMIIDGALDWLETELAEASAVTDRIRTILDEAVSMMPVMPAQEALTLLEEHVHSLERELDTARRLQVEADTYHEKTADWVHEINHLRQVIGHRETEIAVLRGERDELRQQLTDARKALRGAKAGGQDG
jgi:chromosome segregation ATPase